MWYSDFVSGDAYCRYKFERESKNEEIERLRMKVDRANRELHNRIIAEDIVLIVYMLARIVAILLAAQ